MQESRRSDGVDALGEMARAVDEQGKRIWKENEREWREVGRRSGYAIAAVVNLVLIYVANNLLAWNVPFLTSAFVAPLAVFSLSFVATAVANVVFLAYDPAWFRHLVQAGLNVLGFVAVYTLLIVFPFAFANPFWADAVRLALVIVLIAIVIGTVVDLARFLLGHDRRK